MSDRGDAEGLKVYIQGLCGTHTANANADRCRCLEFLEAYADGVDDGSGSLSDLGELRQVIEDAEMLL